MKRGRLDAPATRLLLHHGARGVVQRRRRPRLAPKSLHKGWVGRVFGAEQLDGHIPIEPAVAAKVDGCRAAAAEELSHALTIAKQIDYLGGMPTVTPLAVKTSDRADDMLRFDLDNENETVANYRVRVRQCEALGEFAIAENIRQILMQEQEHQIDLATALGVDVPDVTAPDQMA